LGINLHQIPVNQAFYSYNPTKRDGIGYVNNLNPPVQPNYIDNDGGGTTIIPQGNQEMWSGSVQGYESQVVTSDYDQPRELWDSFKNNPPLAENFISNVAANLSQATKEVRDRTYSMCYTPHHGNEICLPGYAACFAQIDATLASDIEKATEKQVPTGDRLNFPLAGRNRAGVGG
jgi:catalase